jgi:exopolysaccharide biosynthesis protein|tara:strand:- start:360 stop:761 length:402 start_codon:yes stop_codon:yes gene_type:complete
MKNKFELIDYFMIFAIVFFILIGTMTTVAQSYTVTKCDMHDHYVISFIDEFNDKWFLDGEEIITYGKLDLTKKEYIQLIKDIKKTFKQEEKELDRASYAVIKYGWVKDSIWIYHDEKAFSVTKEDIEYLNSKL